MYFLISFLTVYNDLQFFSSTGASFQVLAASLINVDSAILDLPNVLSKDLFADLRFLVETSSSLSTFSHWVRQFAKFRDFQTSVSLICALIWLIDNRFVFLNTSSVCILSWRVVPSDQTGSFSLVPKNELSCIVTSQDSVLAGRG